MEIECEVPQIKSVYLSGQFTNHDRFGDSSHWYEFIGFFMNALLDSTEGMIKFIE